MWVPREYEQVLILHNIRSVHNVGSMFRTADAVGVSRIILSGYSPTPLDQYGRERKDFSKVSLGAEKTIPWEYVKTLSRTLKKLKADGYCVVAIEQDKRSLSLFDWKPPSKKPLAIILGNEVRGLSKSLLDTADIILEIPMRGSMVRHAHHPRNIKRGKESLNVSVTAGIALFELLRN